MNELTTVQELEKTVTESGLAEDTIGNLQAKYLPHFKAFDLLMNQAKTIKPSEPKKARALRLEVKNVRVATDKTRKALKESALLYGRAVDGVYNLLAARCEPLEKTMEEIEKAEEIAEAKRKEALRLQRAERLGEYADTSLYADLGAMTDEGFEKLLAGAKAAHEAQKAAEAAAEAERQARAAAEAKERADREAAEKAERERLRAENERLAKEREEARKVAAAAEKAAAEERAKREKAEAEQWAKEQAARDAEAKKRADEAKAAKKAASAPDKEKILSFAKTIGALNIPKTSTLEGRSICDQAAKTLADLMNWIEQEANDL